MSCKSSECNQIKTLMNQPLRNGDTRYKSNFVMLTICEQNYKYIILQMSNWSSMVSFMETVCWMGPMWFQQCRQSNFLSRMYRSHTPLERYFYFFYQFKIIFHNQLSLTRKHYRTERTLDRRYWFCSASWTNLEIASSMVWTYAWTTAHSLQGIICLNNIF